MTDVWDQDAATLARIDAAWQFSQEEIRELHRWRPRFLRQSICLYDEAPAHLHAAEEERKQAEGERDVALCAAMDAPALSLRNSMVQKTIQHYSAAHHAKFGMRKRTAETRDGAPLHGFFLLRPRHSSHSTHLHLTHSTPTPTRNTDADAEDLPCRILLHSLREGVHVYRGLPSGFVGGCEGGYAESVHMPYDAFYATYELVPVGFWRPCDIAAIQRMPLYEWLRMLDPLGWIGPSSHEWRPQRLLHLDPTLFVYETQVRVALCI